MHCVNKFKHLSLKKVYYLLLTFLIVIPLLAVLVVALLILNQQFKKQAVETIERAQDTVIAELLSDVDVMSIRLSHMVYTNNNEILSYASASDEEDARVRYAKEQLLSETVNLVLEPVKDVISVNFFMKDGRTILLKNEILRSREEIEETGWYQKALENKNSVTIGSFDTEHTNDLYMGSRKDSLILVFALAPDVSTDRSQKIEMVMFYQSTGATERIKSYNNDYLHGKNKLGMTCIVNEAGEIIYSTDETDEYGGDYTCVTSPIQMPDTTWYIKSYIKTSELTSDFWDTARMVVVVAVFIFLLAGYFSSYFLRSIIHPVIEISEGLRKVEDGDLSVHINPSGQNEIRNMVHQFNAMVRRLRALILEYEEKVKSAVQRPQDYFAALLEGRLTPSEVHQRDREFFKEPYLLMKIMVQQSKEKGKESEENSADQLCQLMERNPRFASRCIFYTKYSNEIYIHYRITGDDFANRASGMITEIRQAAASELDLCISVCIGQKAAGYLEFEKKKKELDEMICLWYLKGNGAIIDLNKEYDQMNAILEKYGNYKKLAEALSIADEKNCTEEREHLFQEFLEKDIEGVKLEVYAVILAVSVCFDSQNVSLAEIFGKTYNYLEKIGRMEELRSIKLWITNYFAWIMDYSATKLNVLETDVVVKAKRYIAEHYEDADLSLSDVAAYVGLNEKYFTSRFTKEAGENVISYLTAVRMQKARELLKTTTFKVYEIAEMVGYRNAEHFNRTFKKHNEITPAQYRKTM